MWWSMAAAALAADPQFGVGGHLGTWFLPAAYPYEFARGIRDYDFGEVPDGVPDDVDGDGTPDHTTLTSARGDVGAGIDVYTWMSRHVRFGITSHLALAPGFSDLQAVFVLDRTAKLGRAQSILGGGIGFGTTTWRGTDPDERLRLPSYPARVEAGLAFLASDLVGIELRLIGQVLIPSNHWYTDIAGNEQIVKTPPTTYATLGLQVGLLFGRLQ